MKIDKSFEFDAPQDRVWEFISSPERVGKCFPGCQSVESLGEDRYRAEIKVQMGPIKTVFHIDFEETERREPEYVAYSSTGEEGNRASRLKADSTIRLSALNDSRTRIDYSSEMKIVGRFGKFGSGMVKKKADSMSEEFVEAMRDQIVGPTEEAAVAPEKGKKVPTPARRKIVAVAIATAILLLLIYLLAR